MAHKHGGGAVSGGNPGGEGEKVALLEALQTPLVHGDAGVGVHVVAVAGEVLEDAAHAVGGHLGHHGGHAVGVACRILAEGPVVDKI